MRPFANLAAFLLLAAFDVSPAVARVGMPSALTPVVQHTTPGEALLAPSPLVDGGEFSRRLLSPIAADDLSRFLQSQRRDLAPEPFAAGAERIDLRVPAIEPPGGYGLIIFVPASPAFALPADWKRPLDERGLIFVSLRDAGNDADVIGRRIPLVLHAHKFVADRYRLDPARIHVSGFSGGARLAQRVAMGWPDVFGGSLQFAGSVIVGQSRLPPPPSELMQRFRRQTRVVMVSGAIDMANRRNDALARDTLQSLCATNVQTIVPARLDHWVPDGRVLAKALDRLEAPAAAPDAACEARLQAQIDGELAQAAADADAGRDAEATARLLAIDDRWGGLAAPASVELARRLLARRAGPAVTD